MQNNSTSSKIPEATVVAASGSVIFLTILTIATDLAPSIKAWLGATFTHHWIGKGVLASVLFVALFLLLSLAGKSQDDERLALEIKFLNILVFLGFLLIVFFFLWETFLKTTN